MQRRECYAVIGLAPGATRHQIRKAYRRLAMQHHPDRNGSEEAFKNMKKAYETLSGTGQETRRTGRTTGNDFAAAAAMATRAWGQQAQLVTAWTTLYVGAWQAWWGFCPVFGAAGTHAGPARAATRLPSPARQRTP
jgi:hypothetical protein